MVVPTTLDSTRRVSFDAFNKLKHWRRIATRYDRRSLYFMAGLHVAYNSQGARSVELTDDRSQVSDRAAVAVVVILIAGGWYARRRWPGNRC